jgi:hypothetical protein
MLKKVTILISGAALIYAVGTMTAQDRVDEARITAFDQCARDAHQAHTTNDPQRFTKCVEWNTAR